MDVILKYAPKHVPYSRTNNWTDLMQYFSVPGKLVGYDEFRVFWSSMTFDEQRYYRFTTLY